MNTGAKISFDARNKAAYEAGGTRFVNWLLGLLSGQDYDHGQIETVEAAVEHSHEFIARLSLLLVEKGVLTKEDILKIVEPESLGYTEKGGYKWPENTEKPE